MKMYNTPQPADKYFNVHLDCECGRCHFAPIKAVKIGSGAINSLPGYVKDLGYKRPYIICDEITYNIAAVQCAQLLQAAGIEGSVHILKHKNYDEATLGEIVINMPDDCDLMIGCGTGSITDIIRYASFKMKLPCFTVATAAPMDGFAASVGIMNVDNLKATMRAHSSEVIIGDTDILKSAPYRMTLAGLGDLLGKLNSLNDWRLGNIVNGEHYCKKIDELVESGVSQAFRNIEGIKKQDPEVLGTIMTGLIISGISTSLYGSSRAISGAEHHMSHYWEVLGEQRGRNFAMHGEQVAVATVLTLMFVEELIKYPIDFKKAIEIAESFSYDKWEAEINRVYGPAAETVIKHEKEIGKNSTQKVIERVQAVKAHWQEIKELYDNAMPAEKLRQLLIYVGSPSCPKDIGIQADVLKDTFMYCKETRNRYTVFQLAWDLGIINEISDKVIAILKKKNYI